MTFTRPQVYAIRSFPEGTVRGYGVRVTFNGALTDVTSFKTGEDAFSYGMDYLVGLMADAEKVAA